MGVMGNVTQLQTRTLNPCLRSPPQGISDSQYDGEMPPDMLTKSPATGGHTMNNDTPPDMMVKTGSSRQQSGVRDDPPDMANKHMGGNNMTPQLDTRTETNNDAEATVTDSSDVKCGCSCTCSRMKPSRTTVGASG